MYEYTGHMHIHTTYSDGNDTIANIARVARQEKLDFIIITDHNTLQGKNSGEEGFREGVLVLVEVELDAGAKGEHCLALGMDELPTPTSCVFDILAAIQEKGGVCFLAHPKEKGSPLVNGGRAYPWGEIPREGFAGLEIWNFSSRWRDGVKTLFQAFFNYYLHRPGFALSPCPETVKKWDELTQYRPVAAVGGSDAHAYTFRLGPLTALLFPYPYLFRGVNMHILLREPLSSSFAVARQQVHSALREGNSFVAFDLYKSSRGFKCSLLMGEEEYLPGEKVSFASGGLIQVQSPYPHSLLKVIYNGQEVFSTVTSNMTFKVLKPGVFRVEAHRKVWGDRWRPWIYVNPFYLT